MNTIPPECHACGVIDGEENLVERYPNRSPQWLCDRCAAARAINR